MLKLKKTQQLQVQIHCPISTGHLFNRQYWINCDKTAQKLHVFMELLKVKIVKVNDETELYYSCTNRQMLELGRSKSWTRALEEISGDTRMDSLPLLSYFNTLYSWLKDENQKNNRQPGWDPATDPCKCSFPENSTVLQCYSAKIPIQT